MFYHQSVTYAGKASESKIHAFFNVKEMIKIGHSVIERIVMKINTRRNTALQKISILDAINTKNIRKLLIKDYNLLTFSYISLDGWSVQSAQRNICFRHEVIHFAFTLSLL